MEIRDGIKWIKTLVLLFLAVALAFFASFSSAVESFYSTGFYPWLAPKLRFLLGFFPFSVGDLLYVLAGIWLLKKLVQLFIVIIKRNWTGASLLNGIRRAVNRILWLYIIFNVFWGLNYNRLGIAYQLRIDPDKYDTAQLKQLTGELLQKVNDLRTLNEKEKLQYPSSGQMFKDAVSAYELAEKQFGFLHYQNRSVKKSMYSSLISYMGVLGYYNPFTGEAQVNAYAPAFLMPYVTCHEMAHQLGYGSESEANFVGYLAAKSSKDGLFKYSVYFDLFNYANGELFERDSLSARANYKQLDTLVKLDIKAYRAYLRRYKNPAEPLFRVFYSNYLKANNQPKGIESYNEVVGWLIAYRKKYGTI